jgi:glycosyltransferase involved in cell wall biosynthesis
MKRRLVHIVESAARHQWFEDLVAEIQGTHILQSVVTLEPRGEIFQVLENEQIAITGGKQTSTILKLCNTAYFVKKISRRAESSLVLAQGHMPSISALISKLLFNIDYGIVHHQSPIIFFDSYKVHHPFSGSIHKYLYRHYIRRAKFIQALSLEVFNSLVDIGYPESRIILLGHGIAMNNLKKSPNLEFPKRAGKALNPTILMVGRLSWEKNYLLAFKVIAELVKKCPELNVIIAGTGPDFKSLLEIRNELNLEGNIEMVGWQPNIAELMFEADLFLHLSLTESYGQVLLEACLCGLHVFTFPVGVALDLKKVNNPLIHILNSRNPEEISDGIFSFLKNMDNRYEGKVTSTLEEHSISHIHREMAAYLVAECNK